MSSSVTLGGPPGRKRDTVRKGCTAQGPPGQGRRRAAETRGTRRKGAQRRGEKDAMVPLARHTRARTHTASGQPGGESLSQSTGVCGRPADARGGGAGQVACSPGTIFSSALRCSFTRHTQTSPPGGFPSLTPLPFAPHPSLAAPTEWSCCRCSQPRGS